jgi:gamma-glutamyl-gamma-aminobutyrate hydrolase PuuD
MGSQTAVKSIFDNDELVTLYPWLPLYQRAHQYTVPILPPYQNNIQIASQDEIDAIIYQHALALILDEQDVATTITKTHEDLSALFITGLSNAQAKIAKRDSPYI